MIKVTDEILNKFLDGELSSKEIEHLKSTIKSSDELNKRFEALKLVHNELKKSKTESPSIEFTSKVMQKIQSRFSVSKQQKYFIRTVSAFFIIISVGIIGYVSTIILSSINGATDSSNTLNIFSHLGSYIFSSLKAIFSAGNLSIIGSICSMGIIISGYMFFEHQKRARSNIGNHA